MSIMSIFPALTILVVLSVSLLIVRVATVALTLTGLSKDLAHFQALSAFTGSGFTTRESEDIVNHPTRRRIVMHLMFYGNAGIVLAISSVIISLMNNPAPDAWHDSKGFRISLMLAGSFILLVLASSQAVEKMLWRVNTWALQHWAGLEIHDYTSLLRFSHDYTVYEVVVGGEDWLVGKTLAESQLGSEGVLVLGIERQDGKYIGAPRGASCIEPGDTLILYGIQKVILDLTERRSDMIGNLHHVMAVIRQLDVLEAEQGNGNS